MTKRLRLLLTMGITLVSLTSLHGQSFLTNGLVGYWPLNGNANDESGNGHNGSNISSYYGQSRFGETNGSLVVTGGSSEVLINGTPALDVYSNFTLSAWLYIPSNWSVPDYKAFIAKDSDSIVPKVQFLFRVSASRQYVLWLGDGVNYTQFSSVTPYTVGRWQHVAASFNAGLRQIRLFVDGRLDASYTNSQKCFSAPSFPLHFGNQLDPYRSFNGGIDDVRIYNRALPSNEMASLYYYESRKYVQLVKMYTLDFDGLSLGTNYQLQVSKNVLSWTNWGLPFTAASERYTNAIPIQRVDDWEKIFFRLVPQ